MPSLKQLLLKISMTTAGTWILKTISSRIDPTIFRLTGGRFTSIGPVIVPTLLLTTIGRKSGQRRDAQLVYTDVDGLIYIVASNFGGESHPAWSYNLDADPSATIQLRGETIEITAYQLSEKEKELVWDRLVNNIPNYSLYRERTNRDIKVYSLPPHAG